MLAVESQRLCFCFGEIELVWPHPALPRPTFCREITFLQASQPWSSCGVRVRGGREEREGGLKGGLLELPIADLKSPLMKSRPIRSEPLRTRILLSFVYTHHFCGWSFRAVGSGV